MGRCVCSYCFLFSDSYSKMMIIGNCSVHAIIIRHNTFLEIMGGGGRHISNIENVANERKSLKFHPYRSHTIYISWLRKKNKRIQRKTCHESEKMYEEKKRRTRDPNILVPGVFRLRSKRQLYIAYVTGVLRCHNVRECTYTGRCNRLAIFQAVK
jgi:hypothetical protein